MHSYICTRVITISLLYYAASKVSFIPWPLIHLGLVFLIVQEFTHKAH
jgi:hypothetical protein